MSLTSAWNKTKYLFAASSFLPEPKKIIQEMEKMNWKFHGRVQGLPDRISTEITAITPQGVIVNYRNPGSLDEYSAARHQAAAKLYLTT